jgi:hypothetical protein
VGETDVESIQILLKASFLCACGREGGREGGREEGKEGGREGGREDG